MPRTRDTHAHHIRSLQGPLNSHSSVTYGLTRDSCLNSSSYFHVTEGLAPDIMHDVLEGVAQYEVKELLKYLIEEKLITLDHLNSSIASFSYCYSDIKDKPTPISQTTLLSSDHSIKQKGKIIIMIKIFI